MELGVNFIYVKSSIKGEFRKKKKSAKPEQYSTCKSVEESKPVPFIVLVQLR